MNSPPLNHRSTVISGVLLACIGLMWCVGIFGRGYWTPDEPREADLTWRMSWQSGKAVPLLAGDAFCEKPPLTYWLAALPVKLFGPVSWAARLPNLLYALITAFSVYALARGAAGPLAGCVAAAAMSTLLLSYQVAIWLATDAPLLAAVSVALLGLYRGFYAQERTQRLRGYTLMHTALAAAFLAKSAAGWMVPVLGLGTLIVWERRWRELLRVELYLGLLVQFAVIGTWIFYVYAGTDGAAHLRIFFWNNLVGRFTNVSAPADIQYAAGHKNQPGKYLAELPLYVWPWTLLVIAAIRHAWRARRDAVVQTRPMRFAIAVSLPALLLLSLAATARNVYLAPALPGVALLLGWWANHTLTIRDRWDTVALQATAVMLLIAVLLGAAAAALVAMDAWDTLPSHAFFIAVSGIGAIASVVLIVQGLQGAATRDIPHTYYVLLIAYCVLLIGPTSQVYERIDRWQNLAAIGSAVRQDSIGRDLILFAPDETTRAFVDLYASTTVTLIPAPADSAALDYLRQELTEHPYSVVLAQLPSPNTRARVHALLERLGLAHGDGSGDVALPAWLESAGLELVQRYDLPHGRSYALLAPRHQLAALQTHRVP